MGEGRDLWLAVGSQAFSRSVLLRCFLFAHLPRKKAGQSARPKMEEPMKGVFTATRCGFVSIWYILLKITEAHPWTSCWNRMRSFWKWAINVIRDCWFLSPRSCSINCLSSSVNCSNSLSDIPLPLRKSMLSASRTHKGRQCLKVIRLIWKCRNADFF